MNNTELVLALRWCPSHGCGRCVALDANGRCTLHGVVGLMSQAADALESAEKWIAELESNNPIVESVLVDKLNQRIAELEAQLPKEGEWIEDEYGYIHCSKCGMEWDEPEHPQTNYCPSCGARMKDHADAD